jgi:hypothetical protein
MPLLIVPLEIVEGIISIRLTGVARLLSEIVLAVPFEKNACIICSGFY